MAAIFVAASVFGYIDSLRTDYWGIDTVFLVSIVTTLVALFVFLAIGIPIHLLLKFKSIESVYAYLVAGGIPGIVIVYIFKPFGNDSMKDLAIQASYLSFLGVLSAFIFWLVYYRKRI